jgi:hypothetical protein
MDRIDNTTFKHVDSVYRPGKRGLEEYPIYRVSGTVAVYECPKCESRIQFDSRTRKTQELEPPAQDRYVPVNGVYESIEDFGGLE